MNFTNGIMVILSFLVGVLLAQAEIDLSRKHGLDNTASISRMTKSDRLQ